MNIRIARMFNTYGPGMHPYDGRVVSNFVLQALAGKPLTVFGDGSQTRSFCYRDDLVEGPIRLMNADDSVCPVNLGNPDEFTILELAQLVLELTGSAVEIGLRAASCRRSTKRRPDISLAREKLGWQPTFRCAKGSSKQSSGSARST